jgi:hypothetical protein
MMSFRVVAGGLPFIGSRYYSPYVTEPIELQSCKPVDGGCVRKVLRA